MNTSLHQLLVKQREKIARRQMTFQPPRFAQPLIIVSAPRAGSTLLFETLAHFSDLWTIGEESHEIIEGIPALHPSAHGYSSNRLIATDVTPEIKTLLYDRLARQLQDCQNRPFIELPAAEQPSEIRLLEKTPKNALRIPFLRALFPDARFIFLYRDPAENISSIVDGWQSKRFIAYHALPGWQGVAWSFLLIPGWETLVDRPLVEIAAHQWRVANETIMSDLALLPRDDWLFVRYTDLVAPRAPDPTI
ncbi:MAG: sulfotransferase, partial [Chloroflexota bacterium]|nr:sulfotransferase [Chloroflexota bacterium]